MVIIAVAIAGVLALGLGILVLAQILDDREMDSDRWEK